MWKSKPLKGIACYLTPCRLNPVQEARMKSPIPALNDLTSFLKEKQMMCL